MTEITLEEMTDHQLADVMEDALVEFPTSSGARRAELGDQIEAFKAEASRRPGAGLSMDGMNSPPES